MTSPASLDNRFLCRYRWSDGRPALEVLAAEGPLVASMEDEHGVILGSFRPFAGAPATADFLAELLRRFAASVAFDDVALPPGEFAFVYMDKQSPRMVLGRDPAGIHPLYYHVGADGQLIAGAKVTEVLGQMTRRRFSVPACFDFLFYEYVTDPLTLFEDIYAVPRGALGCLRPGAALDLHRFRTPLVSLGEHAEREPYIALREHIIKAYERRLAPATGLYLSGGIDSNVGALVLKRVLDVPNLRSFTFGVKDAEQSELHVARAVAASLDLPHHEVLVDAAAPVDLEAAIAPMNFPYFGMFLIGAIGEAVRSQGLAPLHLFTGQDTRLHTPHLNVVDRSIFGRLRRLEAVRKGLATGAHVLAKAPLGGKPAKAMARLRLAGTIPRYIQQFFFHRHHQADLHANEQVNEREALVLTHITRMLEQAGSFRQVFNGIVDLNWDRQYTDDIAYMRDATAAGGNFCEFPYYDIDLAYFSAGLPMDLALRRTPGRAGHGARRKTVDKYILRKSFEAELPREHIFRDKAVCITNHLFLNGALKCYVDEWLPASRLRESAMYQALGLEPLRQRAIDHSGRWKISEYEPAVETLGLLMLETLARQHDVS